jgi:hypothetical protein
MPDPEELPVLNDVRTDATQARSKTPTISLEKAKGRFEEWRRNRKGKAPIPDELWTAAVEVARRESYFVPMA